MKTLIEKTILVSLAITQWSGRKFDRQITEEVNEKHNSTDAGRFNKLLIATKHFQAISKIVTQARDFHYKNTLPWGDDGYRLLAATNYFEFTTKIDEYKQRFSIAVTDFCDRYPEMIKEAQVSLNELFNESEYPQKSDLMYKFTMNTKFTPVPEAADLRIDLNAEDVKYLRDEIARDVNEKFADAQRDIFNRVVEQLKYMHSRLADKKAIFRDTLFSNVAELADLLPKLNVAGDERIMFICEALKELDANPNTIRKNVKARSNKADEVKAVLDRVGEFMQ